MSEERLERIENQLDRVVQSITVMQQNMVMMQQNMTAMQQDVAAMQNRTDSMEGTLLTAMTDGFSSLRKYMIDLDIDLARNEQNTEELARKSRRLNQRMMRLENSSDNF
jgi:predicted  nucleic acid-binding Zn-ribbon protein